MHQVILARPAEKTMTAGDDDPPPSAPQTVPPPPLAFAKERIKEVENAVKLLIDPAAGSGNIHVGLVNEAMKCIGIHYSYDDLAKELLTNDADGDGNMEVHEFSAFLKQDEELERAGAMALEPWSVGRPLALDALPLAARAFSAHSIVREVMGRNSPSGRPYTEKEKALRMKQEDANQEGSPKKKQPAPADLSDSSKRALSPPPAGRSSSPHSAGGTSSGGMSQADSPKPAGASRMSPASPHRTSIGSIDSSPGVETEAAPRLGRNTKIFNETDALFDQYRSMRDRYESVWGKWQAQPRYQSNRRRPATGGAERSGPNGAGHGRAAFGSSVGLASTPSHPGAAVASSGAQRLQSPSREILTDAQRSLQDVRIAEFQRHLQGFPERPELRSRAEDRRAVVSRERARGTATSIRPTKDWDPGMPHSPWAQPLPGWMSLHRASTSELGHRFKAGPAEPPVPAATIPQVTGALRPKPLRASQSLHRISGGAGGRAIHSAPYASAGNLKPSGASGAVVTPHLQIRASVAAASLSPQKQRQQEQQARQQRGRQLQPGKPGSQAAKQAAILPTPPSVGMLANLADGLKDERPRTGVRLLMSAASLRPPRALEPVLTSNNAVEGVQRRRAEARPPAAVELDQQIAAGWDGGTVS